MHEERPPSFGGGGVRLGLPRPGKGVAGLIIACVAVFILEAVAGRAVIDPFVVRAKDWWQVWRYLTFQFLHASPTHLIFNMIGLYFLGIHLEKAWGTKRFLRFYLLCGAAAGVCHVILAFAFGRGLFVQLLGASGGVFAVILACAILFPRIRLIVLFFPVPIRIAAALFIGIATLGVLGEVGSALRGEPVSGGVSDVAHLGGALAAAVWIWLLPKAKAAGRQARAEANRGAWERKMRRRRERQEEIDRILAKIHEKGIGSLSEREKRTLRNATDEQRHEERDLYRG